jgi:membrane protein
MVLPVGEISFWRALVGGVIVWEVTRHVLVWYFAKLSMVNVIGGALAATVVVLLTLEAASLILLFGAQVIAEVDRARGWLPGTHMNPRTRRPGGSRRTNRQTTEPYLWD